MHEKPEIGGAFVGSGSRQVVRFAPRWVDATLLLGDTDRVWLNQTKWL